MRLLSRKKNSEFIQIKMSRRENKFKLGYTIFLLLHYFELLRKRTSTKAISYTNRLLILFIIKLRSDWEIDLKRKKKM